jgi:hypothetical protein
MVAFGVPYGRDQLIWLSVRGFAALAYSLKPFALDKCAGTRSIQI